MKKVFTLFTACLLALFCVAQNLVPNPSFEEYTVCPDNLNQLYKATGWNSVRLSPDYFNSCASGGNAAVPQNFWGYKTPASGSAYAGFAGRYGPGDIREFLGIPLISELEIGTRYFVSFKVCLSYKQNSLTCAINNLGVLFSTAIYSENNPAPICNRAHVYSSSIIDNTVSWTSIKGDFVADSNYTFLNVGNFFVDSLTDSIQLQGPLCDAYYYIDDICVSTDSAFCDNYIYTGIKEERKLRVSVYPNPFTEFLIIQYEFKEVEEIQIFNSTGELVDTFYTNNPTQSYLNLRNLPNGLYILCCYNDKIFVARNTILKA